MRFFVLLVGAVFAQADVPPDSALPDVSGDIEVGLEPVEPKASEEPPLASRSTGEWRKFLLDWRKRAISAVPPRFPLREEDVAELTRVRDGNAVSALAALYNRERNLLVRMAYLRALWHIETTPAVEMLVQVSLAEKDARLRRLAAEGMSKMRNRKEAVGLLSRAIRNGQNRDRALDVLDKAELAAPVSPGELPDPALTTALIDSLWVKETRWVQRELTAGWNSPNAASGQRNRYFGRVRVPVEVMVRSPRVLDVLRRYTGEEHDYDQDAWRTWHESRQRESGDHIP